MSWRRKKGRIIARDGDKCHYCELPFVGKGDYMCTFDHIIPVSQGGTNADDNLVLAHRKCNENRGITPYYLYKYKEFIPVNN